MSRWRPMLRLAWRTALRSKGRTALIATLVGLPVFAGVLVDVVVRANTTPVETYARWTLGKADARLEITGYERIQVTGIRNQRDLTWSPAADDTPKRDPRRVDAEALLPKGSRLVPAPEAGVTRLRAGELAAVTSTQLMSGDELTRGMTLVRSGRYPKAANEVAVTTSLARRLDLLESGDRLRANTTVTALSTDANVVGVVDLPSRLNTELLFLPPGTGVPHDRDKSAEDGSGRSYLVDLPALPSSELHALADRLAGQGLMLRPRDSYLNPRDWAPPALLRESPGIEQAQALALGALCVGFGLLEVVLLAGAAFAVGARRQVRELGLIAAAAGGTPKDTRRAVLAQGVVLGLSGALAGTVLALGLPVLAKPLVERVLNHEIDSWPFAPLDYAVLIAIGTLSGLAAALVPAINASRMAPVEALAGRFRSTVGAARPSKLAIALLVPGLAAGIYGSVVLGSTFDDIRRELAWQKELGIGGGLGMAELALPLSLCLVGFALTAFGLVRLMPAVLSWVAAAGRRLPLTVRLAFRDGSRHRHRTGPAAAAIMVAVATSIGVSFFLTGSEAAGRATYNQIVPIGTGIVSFGFDRPAAEVERLQSAAGSALAGLSAKQIPLHTAVPSTGRGDDLDLQARIVPSGDDSWSSGAVDVAGPELLDVYADVPERERAAAKQAMLDGKVVVLSRHFLRDDGTVWIWRGYDSEPPQYKLPAHLMPVPERYVSLPSVVAGPKTAERLGWKAEPTAVLVQAQSPISQREEDLTNGTLSRVGLELFVERGYQPGNPLIPLAATAAAAIVTLAGVAISVALSASESRADLATLAAIGAQPRRRRMLAAAQALLVGGLGCLMGILLGWFVAFAAQAVVGAPEFTVPWANLLATAVLIPLFAALCAALFTSSKLPLVRRVE